MQFFYNLGIMQNNRNPLIFIVEDNPVYNDLISGVLKSNKYNNLRSFKSPEECLKNIHLKPDIIVLNYAYTHFTGLDLMRKIHETKPDIEFIFLSAQNSIEVAVKIVRQGAFDYIVKNEKAPDKLISAISLAISRDKRKKIKRGLTLGAFLFFVLVVALILLVFALYLFNLI